MTSEERRERRYQRRQAKRAANRAKRDEGLTLEAVADLNNLYKACRKAAKGVRWKASVQRYEKDVLRNIVKMRQMLLDGEDFRRGFHEFDLWERGKLRHISSVHFSERVPHKSLNQCVLVPSIEPSLVPGNTANRKGMGNVYAVELLKRQLQEHYRREGTFGYILQFDFSDYFASIPRERAGELIESAVADPRCSALACMLVGGPGTRGLGLGAEPNQTVAVSLPNRIDHHVIECYDVEFYGRYMDDGYVISTDKDLLWEILSGIEWLACDLGLTISTKKTTVTKLTHGFTFLKKRFSYGRDGKVVVRPCRKSITDERRKLRGLHRLYLRGEITYEQVAQHYQSWRGGMVHLDAHGVTLRMDKLFKQLFGG
jgi:hypothetical protein